MSNLARGLWADSVPAGQLGRIGQGVDGRGLLGVTILVSVTQRILEPCEVLFYADAGVFAEQGGDHTS